jgi:hypothetical protein
MVARATNPEEPTPEVLQWCENLMRVIQHNGVWGIPRSGTLFRIDQEKKQLVLVISGDDDDADFDATKHVFKHIGWKVVREHEARNVQ